MIKTFELDEPIEIMSKSGEVIRTISVVKIHRRATLGDLKKIHGLTSDMDKLAAMIEAVTDMDPAFIDRIDAGDAAGLSEALLPFFTRRERPGK